MADLIEQLRVQGRTFDFFQAVMLLEEYFSSRGETDPVRRGRVRFSPDAGVAFPACDISDVTVNDSGVRLMLTFMGLFGVSSPLPQYFSEYITQHEDNPALADFLSIFNHRVYSLFYQAWKKYRALLNRADMIGIIARLAGVQNPNSGRESDLSMLAYTGILTGRRSARGLEGLLSNRYGGIPVSVHQWMPRWTPVSGQRGIGHDAALGINIMIGARVYDVAGKFRVTLGPLPRERFEQFTADTRQLHEVKKIIEDFIADPLEFDIEVQLQALDLIPIVLGERQGRLGVTASLGKSGLSGSASSILIE